MKIVCLGDSLTYGYGIQPYDSSLVWPALLNDRNKVINAGVPGMALLSGSGYWNSSEYLHAIKLHPDAVIFWLGENDSTEEAWNEEKFMQGYALMIEELLEHVTRDHLLLILPLFPAAIIEKNVYDFGIRKKPLERITQIIRKAADSFGVSCFDPNPCLKGCRNCFHDDVHPNIQGNRMLADALSDQLKAMKWE